MKHNRQSLQMVSFVLFCLLCVACSTPQPTLTSEPTSTSAPTYTPEPIPPTQTDTPVPVNTTGQLIKEMIPAPSLENNLLGGPPEKQIAVYLPPSYETSGKNYPAVYFLTGYGDSINVFADGGFQGFWLQDAMDQFIGDGSIKEMIVVVSDGQHPLGGSFYTNSPVTGNWEDFIVNDVVEYVDSHYRTIPNAESRGIAGHSMGGYGALNLAMLHPDVFGAVYSMSPGLFDSDGLSNSHMFASESIIDQYLTLESDLAALSREEAQAALSGMPMNEILRFTVNYGRAFSPNLDKNAPYIDYPYHQEGDQLVLDEEIWERWEAGYGGIDEETRLYKDNLLSLEAITVDWGTSDEYAWIPQGCEYYSEKLTEAGIPHEVETFEGGHMERGRTRIEEHLLPFFSNILAFE
ncbi:MAG: hypothetical protein JXJ17_11420 [Anaerolineae bacterium]|nr:hypothetical protein [Anaerolineae bacterium]